MATWVAVASGQHSATRRLILAKSSNHIPIHHHPIPSSRKVTLVYSSFASEQMVFPPVFEFQVVKCIPILWFLGEVRRGGLWWGVRWPPLGSISPRLVRCCASQIVPIVKEGFKHHIYLQLSVFTFEFHSSNILHRRGIKVKSVEHKRVMQVYAPSRASKENPNSNWHGWPTHCNHLPSTTAPLPFNTSPSTQVYIFLFTSI